MCERFLELLSQWTEDVRFYHVVLVGVQWWNLFAGIDGQGRNLMAQLFTKAMKAMDQASTRMIWC